MKRKLAIMELARHREPRLLVSGQAISNFGDGVAIVALTLLVLDTTHSVTALGWFAAARMTPQVVFLLIGGAIVDRFSRRLLLILSDVVRAVLTGVIVILILSHSLQYWELIVFAVFFGSFDALFYPCIAAFTPEIVTEDLLPAMNAVRPLANNLMGSTIGPAVGGLLAAFSTSLSIGVDCATFVVSALALALMRSTPKPVRKEGATMIGDIKEGLHYVVHTRWLWTTLGVSDAGQRVRPHAHVRSHSIFLAPQPAPRKGLRGVRGGRGGRLWRARGARRRQPAHAETANPHDVDLLVDWVHDGPRHGHRHQLLGSDHLSHRRLADDHLWQRHL